MFYINKNVLIYRTYGVHVFLSPINAQAINKKVQLVYAKLLSAWAACKQNVITRKKVMTFEKLASQKLIIN